MKVFMKKMQNEYGPVMERVFGSRVRIFIVLSLLLVVSGILVPFVKVPVEYLNYGRLFTSILFLGLPIMLLFYGSGFRWTPKAVFLVFILCVVVTMLFILISRLSMDTSLLVIIFALLGLLTVYWTGALGVFVSFLFQERNIIVPAVIVLMAVDFLVVMTPRGTVQVAMESEVGREIFQSVAYKIPEFGMASPMIFIGPADFLFLAMFFSVMHRFGLRVFWTMVAVVIALLFYLVLAGYLVGREFLGVKIYGLPALVPIGMAVLLVNSGEFRMSKQEKQMTGGVIFVCLVLIYLMLFVFR